MLNTDVCVGTDSLKDVSVVFLSPRCLLLVYLKDVQEKVISPEKAEEAKLKARYPNLGNKPGGSDLLRKRLQKGVSWFHKDIQALLDVTFGILCFIQLNM